MGDRGAFEGPDSWCSWGVTHSDDSSWPNAWRTRSGVRDCSTATGCPPSVCLRPAPAELSASDLGLPLLVISQFTLYANTGQRSPSHRDGRRRAPWLNRSWTGSCWHCGRQGQVATGRFGADMQVRLTNDGPITVLFEV